MAYSSCCSLGENVDFLKKKSFITFIAGHNFKMDTIGGIRYDRDRRGSVVAGESFVHFNYAATRAKSFSRIFPSRVDLMKRIYN